MKREREDGSKIFSISIITLIKEKIMIRRCFSKIGITVKIRKIEV